MDEVAYSTSIWNLEYRRADVSADSAPPPLSFSKVTHMSHHRKALATAVKDTTRVYFLSAGAELRMLDTLRVKRKEKVCYFSNPL